MRLGEAVYLNQAVIMSLSRTDRMAVVKKAVEANKTLREIGYKQGRPESITDDLHEKYRKADLLCPLNEYGECLIFDQRPLPCRIFDLPDDEREDMRRELDNDMRQLSKSLFFAFTADFAEDRDLMFTLPEVISGKFVQTFFYILAGMNGMTGNSNDTE
jgi:Fe-S-cluster containining protein